MTLTNAPCEEFNMSQIKEEDVVNFNVSPEYATTGVVKEIRQLPVDEDGYNQYVVEEEDGTTWTLHREDINGVVRAPLPTFDDYERAMQGIF